MKKFIFGLCMLMLGSCFASFTYYSDGIYSQDIGNTTYHSNGQTSQQIRNKCNQCSSTTVSL